MHIFHAHNILDIVFTRRGATRCSSRQTTASAAHAAAGQRWRSSSTATPCYGTGPPPRGRSCAWSSFFVFLFLQFGHGARQQSCGRRGSRCGSSRRRARAPDKAHGPRVFCSRGCGARSGAGGGRLSRLRVSALQPPGRHGLRLASEKRCSTDAVCQPALSAGHGQDCIVQDTIVPHDRSSRKCRIKNAAGHNPNNMHKVLGGGCVRRTQGVLAVSALSHLVRERYSRAHRTSQSQRRRMGRLSRALSWLRALSYNTMLQHQRKRLSS